MEKLLDLFLDGELEARAMRTVALHVTRCPQCERALQQLEHVQDAVADSFAAAVADVDFTAFWPAVEAKAGKLGGWLGPRSTLLARVAAIAGHPVAGAAAVLAALLLFAGALWRGFPVDVATVVRADNQVRIDSLATEARSVALLSEPRTNTTVIWVDDDQGTRP